MANAMTGAGLIAKIKSDFGITLYPAVERAYAEKLQAVIDANPTATDTQLDSLLVNQLLKLSLVRNVLVAAFDENGDGKISSLSELNTSKGALDGTVDAAQADAAAGTVATGQTFTLTAGIDTATANQFIANPIVNQFGNVNDTLNTGDALTATGTGSKLSILNQTALNVLPTLKGIETVSINAGNAVTINGSLSSGIKNVEVVQANGAVTLDNLQGKVETVSLANTFGQAVTVQTLASAVSGSDDSIAVKLNGNLGADRNAGQTVNLTVTSGSNGYETVNIESAGSANSVNTLVATGATKLVVTGDQALTLATAAPLANTVATVDASAFTGDLAIGRLGNGANAAATGVAAATVTLTGGKGADVFVVGATLDALDTINGGDGRDTLAITAAVNPIANLSKVSNIEQVTFINSVGTATVNREFFGGATNPVDTIAFGSGANDTQGVASGQTATVSNLVSGNTIRQNVDLSANPGSLTATLKTNGAADVLNYNVVNTNTTGGAAVGTMPTLTATGYETINIDVSKTAGADVGDTLAITTVADAQLTTLKITGADSTHLTLGTVGGAATDSIDATGYAGNLSLGAAGGLTTAVGGATINTGSGNDTIGFNITTQVLNAINAGAGNDTLNLFGTTTAVSANTLIDLAETDQLATINGVSNATVQTGFRDVSAAGLTAAAVNGVTLRGNAENNVLTGSTADDVILGRDGNDTISGGARADVMSGGAGVDTFNSTTIGDSTATTNFAASVAPVNTNTVVTDTITDFAAGETLNLGARGGAGWALDAGTVGTLETGEILTFNGTYNAATNTFTVNSAATTATANYAVAITFDGDLGTAGVQQETIVLVGHLASELTGLTTGAITLA